MINAKTAGNLLWIMSELQAGTANYLLFGNQYYTDEEYCRCYMRLDHDKLCRHNFENNMWLEELRIRPCQINQQTSDGSE